MTIRLPIRALLAIAALQVAIGIAGVLVVAWTGVAPDTINPPWVFLLQMVAFSSLAALLFAGARGDPRVVSLGVVLALVAVSYARQPATFLDGAITPPRALDLLRGLRLDAFLPLFVWLFFRDFPRGITSPRARALARGGVGVAAVAGTLLLLANLGLAVSSETFSFLQSLDANDIRSQYWALVYGLTLPALPFAIWKAGTARLEERRRVALFAVGVVTAALPISLMVLASVESDSFAHWMKHEGNLVFVAVFQLLVLSIAVTTAYSVLVDRMLPVRVIIRRALQYAMARGAVSALAALPFLWLGWRIYQLRGETLAQLLTGQGALGLGAAVAVGFLAIRSRTRARDAIDRTFFREHYDARQILLSVAKRSRQVTRTADLAQLLATEIDRALHLDRIAVLVADPLSREFRSAVGSIRPLPLGSALATLLSRTGEPVDAELERAGSDLRTLPEEDRQWVADAGARLLVPLVSSSSELIGLVSLGEKRSELPFSSEDRQLLAAIGAAGALTLESRLRVGTRQTRGDSASAVGAAAEEPAWVCEGCGVLSAESGDACPSCSGALAPAAVPLLLFDKFRLERRVGTGGMGVVFRAEDSSLGRPVAIKTLPSTTPENSVQLRHEARAMAAVHHPNLALIYSAESWKGTPLLVTEFLEGGTLADRIGPPSLPMGEVLELGMRLAEGLGRLHGAGILHGDVKPSNIGFTNEAVPKLLDFGLARSVGPGRASAAEPGAEFASPGTAARETLASDQGLVGTPIYMSPEALRGEPPDTSFDLWSLAVVLFEAISSRHPLEQDTWLETLDAIHRVNVLGLETVVADCPAAVADFFRDALHRDVQKRPASAQEFAERLSAARDAVGGGLAVSAA